MIIMEYVLMPLSCKGLFSFKLATQWSTPVTSWNATKFIIVYETKLSMYNALCHGTGHYRIHIWGNWVIIFMSSLYIKGFRLQVRSRKYRGRRCIFEWLLHLQPYLSFHFQYLYSSIQQLLLRGTCSLDILHSDR